MFCDFGAMQRCSCSGKDCETGKTAALWVAFIQFNRLTGSYQYSMVILLQQGIGTKDLLREYGFPFLPIAVYFLASICVEEFLLNLN